MASKDELLALGFEVAHSSPCQAKVWGKWFVGVKLSTGRYVAGYGEDEEAAFTDALATATKVVVENSSTNRHG